MRGCFTLKYALVLGLAAARLAAQAPDTARVDSARVDSARVDSARADSAPPALPTPAQQQYLDGLRRVGRGIAQLRIAVDQTNRAQATADTASRRRAARRLGGLCTSARSFMTGGRARMQPMVFADTTRVKARRLVQRVDAVITYTRTCETEAAAAPAQVTGEIAKRLQAYDLALADFRVAAGLASN
jgi:hypothetical protein